MSGRGRAQPPAEHRFRKGESGNPKGRPRKHRAPSHSSAFEVILEKSLTIMQDGEPRELTIDEALQHKLYQDALAGNRPARRQVLKMIEKREKWLADRAPKQQHRPAEMKFEHSDPENHNEAMLLLGIIDWDAEKQHYGGEYKRYLLEPWAAQAALSRSGSKNLRGEDIASIKRCTRDPDKLRWPASMRA